MIAPNPRSSPKGTGTDTPASGALRLRGSREVALALAEGAGVAEAGRRVGLSRKAVYRRLQDEEFKAHVRELRAELLDEAGGKLSHATSRAAEVLVLLLEGENEFVRLNAARTILESALRMREVLEVEERLAAIEERLQAQEVAPATPARRW